LILEERLLLLGDEAVRMRDVRRQGALQWGFERAFEFASGFGQQIIVRDGRSAGVVRKSVFTVRRKKGDSFSE
jgi:hypothetical protein